MSVYKDEKGRWTVFVRYVDWQGHKKAKKKEGFKTKKEAVEFEREFLATKSKDINMNFKSFVEIYLNDVKPSMKLNSYLTKEYIINNHILPYFKDKNLAEITSVDIMQWQNELLGMRDSHGTPYAATYLRTMQVQLTAIFNHAVTYYELPKSPCKKVKKMGKAKSKEMLFWTVDEYLKFSEEMKSKPISFYAFEVLFWTGIRMGELLALECGDIDLEKRKLHITKSLQRIGGEDIITDPKTENGIRTIDIPDFLCDELEDYMAMLYKATPQSRLFSISDSYLHHEMDRGSKASGVKRIRIHDLRHSHVAHLVELGFSPVAIAERMGHESATITCRYAHLYPSKQKTMADKLSINRTESMKKDK